MTQLVSMKVYIGKLQLESNGSPCVSHFDIHIKLYGLLLVILKTVQSFFDDTMCLNSPSMGQLRPPPPNPIFFRSNL